ncbi:MAG: hypothetical protein QW057_07515 [Candidatus Bathyarchaeia archaeon]
MADLDEVISHLERLSRLEARLHTPELERRLAQAERLDASLRKLEAAMLSHPRAEILELRATMMEVLKDPTMDRAQKAAAIARRIEVLKKRGVIDIKSHRDLVGLGLLLIAVPEPTMISDVIGLCMIAAGMLLEAERRRS